MAVGVKVGDIYPDIKRGVSAKKGEWAYVVAKAEKGSDKLTIWFANPQDIPEGTFAVEVKEILEARQTAHQYNGAWVKDYAIRAVVSPVEGGATAMDTEDYCPF